MPLIFSKEKLIILGVFTIFLVGGIYFLFLKSDAYQASIDFAISSKEIALKTGNIIDHTLVPCCMQFESNGIDGKAKFQIYFSSQDGGTRINFQLSEELGIWTVESYQILK